jgi:5-methylcytosine-specific restriction endonuclease McrA/ribosomal protein S27AE
MTFESCFIISRNKSIMNFDNTKNESNYDGKKTYADLLLMDEWRSKREEILSRDNYTCTECQCSDSMWVKNLNIYYNFENPGNKELITDYFSIDEFKEKFNVQVINIYKHKSKRDGDYFFGISDNNILLGFLSTNNVKGIKKNELRVFIRREDGGGVIPPIIDYQDMRGLKGGIFLPKASPKSILMHVHHKRYIKGRNPWEYNNEDLITLCNWCHWKLHENEKIPIYDYNSKGELVKLEYQTCSRCNGAGVFPEFAHVENGICFRCGGAKYDELI